MTTTRGRRRDPAKDEAILVATRRLLIEEGYAALSMEAVAGLAGVSKPTLYLRYSNKALLVFEAVFGKTKSRAVPDSGSVVDELREAYSWAVDEFAAPEARAALPGLLGELVIDAFTGTALARVGLLDHPVDHAYAERLVDLLVEGLRPAARS